MLRRQMRLPIVLSMIVVGAFVSTAQAQYGTRIVDFCAQKLNKPVGSGECAHLATESLRVAGAEFLRNGMADSPASGDYTWGNRVKLMQLSSNGNVTDSNPSSKCQPGDIVQYRLGSSKKTHHTTIVASVNSSGYPTAVYQQNWNSQRFVTKDSTDLIRLLKDRGGYLQIFRAKSPVSQSRTEFTLVNNSTSSSVSYKIGTNTRSIGKKNTETGFSTNWMTGSSKLTLNGVDYSIAHRRGYEFYTTNGTVKLRVLNP